MRTHVWLVVLVVVALCSLPVSASFAATITSDFRDFKNPFLVTYRGGQILDSYTTKLGPVKISFNVGNLSFSGGSYVTGTPSDPANVSGWGAVNQTLPLIFNMDMSIGAFGITFDNVGNTAGSILAVYDGPNGTGQLIGQIESVRVPPPWSATNQPIDFVGVIDEHNQIRSAVLTAHGSDAIRIRAMAISIPEPSTLVLALAGLTLITQWFRHVRFM